MVYFVMYWSAVSYACSIKGGPGFLYGRHVEM